jgi:AAA+ ATPase superfamily predicted ATPase
MKHSPFVGRESEMETLEGLLSERTASLIVIRGRRRIGKSRLIEEFAKRSGKQIQQFFFMGTPPTKKTTKKIQRNEFVKQLARGGVPGIQPDDWGDMFWHLSKHAQHGPVLIVFDEISWMGNKDPEFLGKLKNSWDMYFSKNPELILILCGSVSSWIEENIIKNTGFLGRIKNDIQLEELPLNRCNAFWHPKEKKISSYEKFKLLSVTGGVPLYLERIKPHLTAEQNILNLCFKKDGLLVHEFDKIFSEIFSKSTPAHKEIVSCLANGPKDLVQICKEMGKPIGGTYSKQLEELDKAGFTLNGILLGF